MCHGKTSDSFRLSPHGRGGGSAIRTACGHPHAGAARRAIGRNGGLIGQGRFDAGSADFTRGFEFDLGVAFFRRFEFPGGGGEVGEGAFGVEGQIAPVVILKFFELALVV